jgi:hypothetical protein
MCDRYQVVLLSSIQFSGTESLDCKKNVGQLCCTGGISEALQNISNRFREPVPFLSKKYLVSDYLIHLPTESQVVI